MILKILVLISSALLVHSLDKHSHKTTDDPVYLLDQEYIVIDGYHGSMDSRTLELFGNVETLVLQNCNFTTFNENYAHPLKNLKKLVIANSHFDRVKSEISVCCKKLREIALIDSHISALDEDMFKKMASLNVLERVLFLRMDVPVLYAVGDVWPNLKEFEVLHSKLETIQDGAFKGMEKLEILDLRFNKLKSIPTKSLANLKALRMLNLGSNDLEKVTTDDFPSLPHLEKLDLGHNPIKEINLKGLKEKMPNIKRVEVTGINIEPSDAEGIPLMTMNII